ncbi:baseplate J/gp47 family protein [Paenibacillus melissococcoides]|uniref:Baseplate J/gp47 family protein n=2 Tax=Paenibacillus TaxID=44249 RepID=A0ABM9FWW2_9BACL|nr:baseplate J/gp47 family protein [Paenibacillus melissococcoides]CAH8243642.1 baseplate J/gp47 family protein [Paenibacillus melissococcoides]CAH8705019.1 baseplate J/gp47 family protein [Paenibacillus melissococcoides]CAH8707793.1 baseplate J/gp47 family protein [Paenibacillus melissococcoides]
MALIDLPDIQFVDIDVNKTVQNMITSYEALSGRKLYPADPVRLFLLSIAQLIVQQRVVINHTAKQNLLRYATGDYLDHLGAMVETERLQAEPAKTTVRFHLSAPRPEAVLIPAGIRVSPGGELFFATVTVGEVKPGALHVDVPCECLAPGLTGNGFIPGQINTLVDPLPWVDRVENLTESSGGTDREDDDRYRERIYTSPERFSVAGPTGAYEYWARSAHKDIMDVLVWSPAPVEVEIRVLMQGGELPTQDVLNAVHATCNSDRIRPLTDKVTVIAPDAVSYDIDFTYWIDSRNATDAANIQARVHQAVESYIRWQKGRIGRDINPSEMIRLVMNAGARRVAVKEPAHTIIDKTQVAIAGVPKVTYGGLEDD